MIPPGTQSRPVGLASASRTEQKLTCRAGVLGKQGQEGQGPDFCRFLCVYKSVSTRFFYILLFGCVFELLLLRNTQKRDKQKPRAEGEMALKFLSIFVVVVGFVSDMDVAFCKN
jgi:hypothetical protein